MSEIAHWYASEGDGVPWVVIEANGMHHVIAECDWRGHAEKIARALNDTQGAVARAEKAEHDLRRFQSGLTDVLRVYNVPAMPSWPEAIHWLARHGRKDVDA